VVDALILSEYVLLAAKRHAGRRVRSMAVMAARDLDRVLILGAGSQVPARFAPEDLAAFVLRWLVPDG
jgi:hypothetical protein